MTSSARPRCRNCDTPHDAGARFCANCGQSFTTPGGWGPAPLVMAPPESGPSTLQKFIGSMILIGGALWLVSLLVGTRSLGVPSWTPPAGYTQFDAGTAYQWVANPKCTYSTGSCWGALVVSRNACPNGLYGEISLIDASGTAIGYTNDDVGAVAAGQTARMTFDTFNTAASKAKLTKISCF